MTQTETYTDPRANPDPYQAAADRQGLRQVQGSLNAIDVRHTLYQSGGFCMIVEVLAARGIVIWITNDNDTYLVSAAQYDEDGERQERCFFECESLADMNKTVTNVMTAAAR